MSYSSIKREPSSEPTVDRNETPDIKEQGKDYLYSIPVWEGPITQTYAPPPHPNEELGTNPGTGAMKSSRRMSTPEYDTIMNNLKTKQYERKEKKNTWRNSGGLMPSYKSMRRPEVVGGPENGKYDEGKYVQVPSMNRQTRFEWVALTKLEMKENKLWKEENIRRANARKGEVMESIELEGRLCCDGNIMERNGVSRTSKPMGIRREPKSEKDRGNIGNGD